MNRQEAIRKLIKDLPQLLADYEHLAADEDGNVDTHRQKVIAKFKRLRDLAL